MLKLFKLKEVNQMTSITLSLEIISTLSLPTRTEILNVFQQQNIKDNSDPLENDIEPSKEDLTQEQVNKLIRGLSKKSRRVLRTISEEYENDNINEKELLVKLDMVGKPLSGVWSGITGRARFLNKNNKYQLIKWKRTSGGRIGFIDPTTFGYISTYFASNA